MIVSSVLFHVRPSRSVSLLGGEALIKQNGYKQLSFCLRKPIRFVLFFENMTPLSTQPFTKRILLLDDMVIYPGKFLLLLHYNKSSLHFILICLSLAFPRRHIHFSTQVFILLLITRLSRFEQTNNFSGKNLIWKVKKI